MVDTFTKEKRRQIMQSVRRENTKPEAVVSGLLERFALPLVRHNQDLPGRPDFYIPSIGTIVFVHGCFWHGHNVCNKGRTLSKSNGEYWRKKIERNKKRDRSNVRKLRAAGYSVFTLWECELRKKALPSRLVKHIEGQVIASKNR
jgi:DNA mismatch endonuclease (patch repair protein)